MLYGTMGTGPQVKNYPVWDKDPSCFSGPRQLLSSHLCRSTQMFTEHCYSALQLVGIKLERVPAARDTQIA